MPLIVKPLLAAYGGYTIARDDKVVLVKGAIPGEVVDVTIQEKKRDYTLATVSQVVEPSEHRVKPKCPVFGVCGGCHLQYVSYNRQLSMKEEVLLDSLQRLGKLDVQLGPSLSDASWNYRHRAQFKVSKEGVVGFFRESSRDIVAVESCPLMKEEINSLLQRIKEQGLASGLKEIHLSVGDTAVALLKGDGVGEDVSEHMRDIGVASIACNEALTEGSGYAAFDLMGLKYTVSPWTFFQSHWTLNRKVAERIVQLAGPWEGKTVLDLYAGAGNFSLPVAGQAQEIVLVEENPHAIEDGTRNLKLNSIKNCRFMKSSAEKYKIPKHFNVLILDPPRPGLSAEASKKVLESVPDKIVYISCNPSTLARDLKKFKEAYDITSVQMIDFFPHTFHIEAVVVMQVR